MEHLPSDVSPDNPIDPKNDAFNIIPAGGRGCTAVWEELTLPVSPQGLFKRRPDLRGRKVYVKPQFKHRLKSCPDTSGPMQSQNIEMATPSLNLSPIGQVHSPLTQRSGAPRRPWEDATQAKLEIYAEFVQGLDGIQPGQDIWVLTLLHESRRSTLKVYPRGDTRLT
jgi:hypothetical protein